MESLLQHLLDLLQDPDTKDTLEETARIYFAGTEGVTVNLIPGFIIGGLLLLGLLKLLGFGILGSLGGFSGFGLTGSGGGGYGTSGSGYGAAAAGRGDYYDTVADLQEQINQLAASNEALTSQVYYGTAATNTAASFGPATNLIGTS